MLKITFLSAILFVSSGVMNAQDMETYVDSMLTLIWNGKMPALNHQLKQIPYEILAGKIQRIDTVINDQWTRPRFIDNIYHQSFDGVVVKNWQRFDTIPVAGKPGYIGFLAIYSDNEGNFINSELSFLVPRIARPARPVKLKKRNCLAKQITTSDKTCWSDSEIVWNGKKIELDSCHFAYRLFLHKYLLFEQDFTCRTMYCNTKEMAKDIEVSVEGPADLLFEYYDKVKGHFIENPAGIWSVRDRQLVLSTMYGRVIVKFVIDGIEADEMRLSIPDMNYTVVLRKQAVR